MNKLIEQYKKRELNVIGGEKQVGGIKSQEISPDWKPFREEGYNRCGTCNHFYNKDIETCPHCQYKKT